jgi:hypothetical protein
MSPPVKALTFKRKTNDVDLIIKGQGVLLFECANNNAYTFFVDNADKSDGLRVELDAAAVKVTRISTDKECKSKKYVGGLSDKPGAYYWFSLDSQNQILQLGIGEARIDTLIYHYGFPSDTTVWETNKTFLESLVSIRLTNDITPLRLLADPVTNKIPLVIKDTHDLTMHHVANGKFMPWANLSSVAQRLYNCISGKHFVLNTKDFPDFTKAIERSIATPGLWCNKRLLEKANEFDKEKPNFAETYLRITLGRNNGESPGVPYVMEIWPVGHYSPVHNHGGAHAIIRVLHGSINTSLFPFLSDATVEPFATADFAKGDITWISPTLNQVHQLKNLETSKETCITIQCYTYDDADRTHYDYFDYIDGKGAKMQYEPDSDMDFIDFKEQMKKEWEARGKSAKPKRAGSSFFSSLFCKKKMPLTVAKKE